MAYANYLALKTALNDWLSRSDVPWDSLVSFVESDINERLVTRYQISTTTLTTSNGTRAVTAPSDMIAIEALVRQTAARELLEPVTIAQLANLYPEEYTGEPEKFSVVGTNIRLGPTPDGTYNLECIYRARVSALSGDSDTNDILTYYPAVYFYGCLSHAAPYLRNDERVPLWAQYYQRALDGANQENERAELSGGPVSSSVDFYTP